MTREEALSKDEALHELTEAIRNLPSLRVWFGVTRLAPDMVSREKVLVLLQQYGFHG